MLSWATGGYRIKKNTFYRSKKSPTKDKENCSRFNKHHPSRNCAGDMTCPLKDQTSSVLTMLYVYNIHAVVYTYIYIHIFIHTVYSHAYTYSYMCYVVMCIQYKNKQELNMCGYTRATCRDFQLVRLSTPIPAILTHQHRTPNIFKAAPGSELEVKTRQ